MNPSHSPKSIYQAEVEQLKTTIAKLQRKQQVFGWLRLVLFIVTIISAYVVFTTWGNAGWAVVAVGIAAFLMVVSADTDNKNRIANTLNLLHITEEEILVLNHQFQHRYTGAEYAPPVHNYAGDLDVFGAFSLFQYINRCQTEGGKTLLAQSFLHPLPVAQIHQYHEAIKEITPQYEWRRQLQAFSLQTPITIATQTRIENWLAQAEEAFTGKAWKVILPLYALITISSAIAALLGYLSGNQFSLLFLIYFITSSGLSKKPSKAYNYLSGITNEVSTLSHLISWIEEREFKSQLLQHLQQSVRIKGDKAAYQIKSLKELLSRFDLRLNVVLFVLLNSFLLWDVRQMIALNNWKRNNKAVATKWFQMIAAAEGLNSLAVLHFNKPGWCFPTFSDAYFTFKSTALGHPLLQEEQRVDNDFEISGAGKMALITGSNMAGKSTFLRSLGANAILAFMGAPVCAKSLQVSPVQLISSMRISDNLGESTSTFYAELKKLKTVIEAVNRHEPFLILLDEILRGTNSLDRHAGSKALIRQLIKEGAVAVIATHDAELTKLADEYAEAIDNYHFDMQFTGEDLSFDYTLKEGVCTNLNAAILMKKIGLDLS